ncbi:MAG: NfeD family protein [Fulvimonas sp.]|jgi:membrane protein implicated in regulation of membrane protease activity|nr:NfeD family protein [Fulvimonas sp.]
MSAFVLPYLWWILALLLLLAEMLLPGYFLLWIGIASAATGLLTALVPGLSLLLQALAFAGFAAVSCALYGYLVRPRLVRQRGHDERLNRRAEQLLGRRCVLVEDIVNGQGRAQVGDSVWPVTGPDLPAGTPVQVIGIDDGIVLRVRAVAACTPS